MVSARAREPNTLAGTLLGLGLVTLVTAVLIPVQAKGQPGAVFWFTLPMRGRPS